jgi:hypothetical protein
MMGSPTNVCGFTATLAHERIEVEDTAVACLRFKSGALGVIQATTSIYPGLPKTIAIHGDKGTAVVEQDDLLRWEFNPETPEDEQLRARFAQKTGASGGSSDPSAISHVGHARQLADFVASIQSGKRPLVDGHEGRRRDHPGDLRVGADWTGGGVQTLDGAKETLWGNRAAQGRASSSRGRQSPLGGEALARCHVSGWLRHRMRAKIQALTTVALSHAGEVGGTAR